ncbi:NADPH:quinone reductase [Archangium sp.]|uniref:NADPH:quinone reductase n=1 Tax=Archangium sp. TaxID=1872627 RepID=UPI002D4996A2|nr:NADPH:quinone reductase [Archangium sp.]HYO56008.1 NADPH:quinone reductase [Archangium sp.]
MKAAWYDATGSATDVLKVGELPVPEPGPNEVLVRVLASGVNPHDVKKRLGKNIQMEFPRIVPHCDGAGIIEKVGVGVPASRVGQRVWLHAAQWKRPFGTAAQFIALPASLTAPLPENISFEQGATLGIPAMTAHRCVFADGPVYGKTVLVHGGAGAVGHHAIQLARTAGAEVIATVSSPEKATLARSAGADHVINYRQEEVAARIKELTRGAGVDRVIEVAFGQNLALNMEVLKASGTIAAYASDAARTPTLPFYPMMYASLTVRTVLVFNIPEAAVQQAISDINALLARGLLSSHISARFPLEQIARAHEAVEAGPLGKVVVGLE